jgi:Holliday junction resolvasome RuvABC endonuclease subunit
MNHVYMLSLDTSSESSGYAVYDKGILTEDHGHIDHPKKRDGDVHTKRMCQDLLALLNRVKPCIVVAEEPPYARGNPGTHMVLCIILGTVYGWCLEHDCEFNLINTATWRAAMTVLGPVPRDREGLKRWSMEITGLSDDNEADAVLIGRAWLRLWDRQESGILW